MKWYNCKIYSDVNYEIDVFRLALNAFATRHI